MFYLNGLPCVGPDQRMRGYTQALMLHSEHRASDRNYKGIAPNFQEQASMNGALGDFRLTFSSYHVDMLDHGYQYDLNRQIQTES